ncbi:MAG: aminoacetone oxidase family FAD-binding enzyme [Campylobacterota bacterium]|nr:aminoacetone oxidase family FAD-binding enzyme [Campylobacterota bacterium]
MKIYDVIILGAGASGLMCAANIGKKKSVAILEGNSKVAKKLKISGGGKCNITNVNVSVNNFDGERSIVSHALKKFSKEALLRFLDRNRIELELRKERYYFCKNSSDDIINVLEHGARFADIILDTSITSVEKKSDVFEVKTQKENYFTRELVVATGGKSYETIGASEIGLEIAKSFGIEVKEFTPALVGLTLQKEQFWMRELSGLSCYVEISVGEKLLYEEMLFAHKGISGPAVLSASLYWVKGEISINFLPQENILETIQGNKKLLSTAIGLPKRLSKSILKALEIEDKECRKITEYEKKKLSKIHNYSFSPAGNFGFSKAEVSRGGVLCDELNIETLESKKVKGLYFIGEVADITGELGGYNFQWAFSSAYLCAKAIK